MNAQASSRDDAVRVTTSRTVPLAPPVRRASTLIAARGSGRFARWHFGAPSEAESDENWLLSYLDLFTLLLAMLVVMLGLSRMNKPLDATDDALAQASQVPLAAMLAQPQALTPSATGASSPPSSPPIAAASVHTAGDWQPLPELDRAGPVVWVKDAHAAPTPHAAVASNMPAAPLVSVPPPTEPPLAPPELAPPSLQALGLDTLGSAVDVIVNEKTISLRISSELLFPSGQATLGPDGSKVIKSIALALAHNPYDVSVEGHSDSVTIQNKQFASNWELSSGRAASVLRELINDGVAGDRLRAVGYAHTRPLAGNDTADGRALNRRVELILAVAPGQVKPGDLPTR